MRHEEDSESGRRRRSSSPRPSEASRPHTPHRQRSATPSGFARETSSPVPGLCARTGLALPAAMAALDSLDVTNGPEARQTPPADRDPHLS